MSTLINAVLIQLEELLLDQPDLIGEDLLNERLLIDKTLRGVRRFWRAQVPAQHVSGTRRLTKLIDLEVEAPNRVVAQRLATEQAQFLAKDRNLWLMHDNDMESLREYSAFMPTTILTKQIGRKDPAYKSLVQKLKVGLSPNAKRRYIPHATPLVAYANTQRKRGLVASIAETPKFMDDGYLLIGRGAPFAVLAHK